jgi:Zn-dependent protease with chaperone function
VSATGVAHEPIARPPLNIISLPRATTTAFAVLVVSILVTGLFLGRALDIAVSSDDWAACRDRSAAVAGGADAQQAAFTTCLQPDIRAQLAVSVAVCGLSAAAGVAIIFAAPALVTRRRRLRPLTARDGAAWDRTAWLARQAGLTRLPTLVRGPPELRQPFCFGTPGRYRIAVPIALLVRPRAPAFDPMLRHELAHLRHQDVALSWLARGLWYAVGPLLALPAVVYAVQGAFSLLADYLWRALVIAGAIALVQRLLLRAREFDADLAAAWLGGFGPLRAVLAGGRADDRTGWRRALRRHPTRAERIGVLDEPARSSRMTFTDGLTAAFLAALAVPVLDDLLLAFHFADARAAADVAGAGELTVGTLLGVAIGLMVWRQAVPARALGLRAPVARAACGAGVGAAVGHLVSFSGIGQEYPLGFAHPLLAAIPGVAMAGAVIVLSGLAELGAAAAHRLGGAGPAIAALVGGALVAFVLWASGILQFLVDGAGWPAGLQAIVLLLSPAPVAVLAVVLAALAGAGIRAGRAGFTAPASLLPPGARLRLPPVPPGLATTLGVGLAAGLGGYAVLVGTRLLAGPPTPADAEQRLLAMLIVIAVAGAAAAVALGIAFGGLGRGAGLCASAVATSTATAAFVVDNTMLGGDLTVGFVWGLLRPALAMGLMATILLSVASPALPRPGGGVLAALLAVGLAAGAGAGVETTRDVVAPTMPDAVPAAVVSQEAVTDYKERLAPVLFGRSVAVDDDCRALRSPISAEQVRATCLVPSANLRADASRYVPPGEPLTSVHQVLLGALNEKVRKYDAIARYASTNDAAALAQAKTASVAEDAGLKDWANRVADLP